MFAKSVGIAAADLVLEGSTPEPSLDVSHYDSEPDVPADQLVKSKRPRYWARDCVTADVKRVMVEAAGNDERLRLGADKLTDGSNCARPCPYVSCQNHTYAEVTPLGDLYIRSPIPPDQMSPMTVSEIKQLGGLPGLRKFAKDSGDPSLAQVSCFADILSFGEMKLDHIGNVFGLSRERIRQIVDTVRLRIAKMSNTNSDRVEASNLSDEYQKWRELELNGEDDDEPHSFPYFGFGNDS